MWFHRRSTLFKAGTAVLVASSIASCKEATQTTVLVRTNVPYQSGVTMALWSSVRGVQTGAEPQVTYGDAWLSDGTLGDVVVTPRQSKDEPLVLRVVLGIGRDPSGCTDNAPAGCVVARRKLAFVPHARLRVPVVLHLACAGVVCSEDATCNYLGQCVSATVDPTSCAGAEGCALPGDETVTGVTDAGLSAADAAADARGPADGEAGSADADAGGPLEVDGGAALGVRLSAGNGHTCAIVNNGQLKCWGGNASGQLGLGDTLGRGGAAGQMGANLPAVDLGPGRTAVEVGAGNGTTCARLDNGSVKCWGSNTGGRLGIGDTADRGDNPAEMGANLPAVNLGPGRSAVELAVGLGFACARLDDGSVKCWGSGAQLGLGDNQDRGGQPSHMGANLPALDFGPGRSAVQLACGGSHSCARLDDGTIKCWGDNTFGKLGLGDSAQRGAAPGQMGANLPAVNLGTGVSAVRAGIGFAHSCAIVTGNALKCWGSNGGNLGIGAGGNRGDDPFELGDNLPFVDLGPGRSAEQVVGGFSWTCARMDDGRVKCFGSNGQGQLGLGDTLTRGGVAGQMGANLPAIDFGAGRTARTITAGSNHGCALLDNGAIKCWGGGANGSLGLGDTLARGDSPGEMGDNLPAVPLQ